MVLFALALVPLIGAAGVALDFARASDVQTKLQAALDATALAIAEDAALQPKAEVEALAAAYLKGNFPDLERYAVGPMTVRIAGGAVEVEAGANVPTSLTAIFGRDAIRVSALSRVGWGKEDLEVVLALDNTGSMKGEKIEQLKQASRAFLDTLGQLGGAQRKVRVAIVPFNTQVNVESIVGAPTATGKASEKRAAAPSWMYFPGPGESGTAHWDGCIGDRDMTGDYDTNADPASPADPASLYPGMPCTAKPAPIVPLTDDFARLRDAVDAMEAGGATNITIGVAWALAALTPHEPLLGAAPFGSRGTRKMMILVTDGLNNESRFVSGKDGSSEAARAAQMNVRTRMACQSVKDAGVELYTIRVIDGDEQLLAACASRGETYNSINSASQLAPLLLDIARRIIDLRITA
jgi:Mg-chelatase subunit ChlD